MRKILVIIGIFVLIFAFLHYRRIDVVNNIYQKAMSDLDRNDLSGAMKTLKSFEFYTGYKYLVPPIEALREKFYLRVKDDMLVMAREKRYRKPDGYNACGAYNVLEEYTPHPDWLPGAFIELADIVLPQDQYFLSAESDFEIDTGKYLYSRLNGNPYLTPKQKLQVGEAAQQMGFYWMYLNRNFEGQYKKEIRNGKPYYYDSWSK